MRKSTIALLVVALLCGAVAWVVLARPFASAGAGVVEELATSFMEDIQFKDFRSSALYHHRLDQGRLDVGQAIEKFFKVKPEQLDIRDYRIIRVDVGSEGRRAKTLVRTRYKLLDPRGAKEQELREADLMLYWLRRHPDCPAGGKCPAGHCVDEQGRAMLVPLTQEQARQKKRGEEVPRERFPCNEAATERWTMNLDSTLEEKEYTVDVEE